MKSLCTIAIAIYNAEVSLYDKIGAAEETAHSR